MTYIVKPGSACQGRGIFLAQDLESIKKVNGNVAQEYIPNPLTIHKKKFDLRIYVLITSVRPLRMYLFQDGLARFCTEDYVSPAPDNLKTLFGHLTNYTLNKANDKFVHNEDEGESSGDGSKWTLDGFNEYMEQAIGKDELRKVWMRIHDVLIKSILVAAPVMQQAYKTLYPRDGLGAHCFQFLGFDIMLDSDLRPWLIEINRNPSLRCDTPLDQKIKTMALGQTFYILDPAPYLQELNELSLVAAEKLFNVLRAKAAADVASASKCSPCSPSSPTATATASSSSSSSNGTSTPDDAALASASATASAQPAAGKLDGATVEEILAMLGLTNKSSSSNSSTASSASSSNGANNTTPVTKYQLFTNEHLRLLGVDIAHLNRAIARRLLTPQAFKTWSIRRPRLEQQLRLAHEDRVLADFGRKLRQGPSEGTLKATEAALEAPIRKTPTGLRPPLVRMHKDEDGYPYYPKIWQRLYPVAPFNDYPMMPNAEQAEDLMTYPEIDRTLAEAVREAREDVSSSDAGGVNADDDADEMSTSTSTSTAAAHGEDNEEEGETNANSNANNGSAAKATPKAKADGSSADAGEVAVEVDLVGVSEVELAERDHGECKNPLTSRDDSLHAPTKASMLEGLSVMYPLHTPDRALQLDRYYKRLLTLVTKRAKSWQDAAVAEALAASMTNPPPRATAQYTSPVGSGAGPAGTSAIRLATGMGAHSQPSASYSTTASASASADGASDADGSAVTGPAPRLAAGLRRTSGGPGAGPGAGVGGARPLRGNGPIRISVGAKAARSKAVSTTGTSTTASTTSSSPSRAASSPANDNDDES